MICLSLRHFSVTDCAYWSTEERDIFKQSWKIYGKDFSKIKLKVSQVIKLGTFCRGFEVSFFIFVVFQLPDKTLKDVIEYYYSWKLVNKKAYKQRVAQTRQESAHEKKSPLSSSPGKHASSTSISPSFCSKQQKRRRMSCQFDGCFKQFDSVKELEDHQMACHSVVKNGFNTQKLGAEREIIPTSVVSKVANGGVSSSGPPNGVGKGLPAAADDVWESTANNGHFPCEVCGK